MTQAEEVYTCSCDAQAWFIHKHFVKCRACGRKYAISCDPKEFNETRKKRQLNPNFEG